LVICQFCRKRPERIDRRIATAAIIGPEKPIPINDFLESH
jgi:hypothetical protein